MKTPGRSEGNEKKGEAWHGIGQVQRTGSRLLHHLSATPHGIEAICH